MSEQEVKTDIVKSENKSINAFTSLPETFDGAQRYCEYLASSKVVPQQYQGKPQDIFVAISWGQQVGLTNPMMALKNISVINGTPSMWGNAPLALVRRSPLCEFILEDNEAFAYARDHISGWEHLKDVDPESTSICVGKRVGEPVAAREFSVAEVKTAGLEGRNVHGKYPKDMRKYKARSRLIDYLFADVVEGIAQAELVKEQVELEGKDAEPEELQNGLKDESDAMADSLIEGLKDPESEPEENSDVSEAEIVEEEKREKAEDTPPAEADSPQGETETPEAPSKGDETKWVSSKAVQDIVKSAKYLPKDKSNELAQLIGKQNGKLRPKQAEEWQDEIRAAHEEAKKNKR